MSDDSPAPAAPHRPRRGMTALGTLVPASVGPVFSKRGFAGADLAVHWTDIVGPQVARFCRPLQMQWPKGGREAGTGATLTVACSGAFALDLQQMAPVLLERLNRRLGWRCITRLAIRQMPVRPIAPPPGRSRPSAEDVDEAGRIVAGIQSDDLRNALVRLGAGALNRQRTARKARVP